MLFAELPRLLNLRSPFKQLFFAKIGNSTVYILNTTRHIKTLKKNSYNQKQKTNHLPTNPQNKSFEDKKKDYITNLESQPLHNVAGHTRLDITTWFSHQKSSSH